MSFNAFVVFQDLAAMPLLFEIAIVFLLLQGIENLGFNNTLTNGKFKIRTLGLFIVKGSSFLYRNKT